MTAQTQSNQLAPQVVVIGSGVGGGTVALKLARAGLRVLMLERGEALPNEPELNDAEAVFVQNRYRTQEQWQDDTGRRYRPGQYYFLGGHTKFYGTAMFRFRESDFAETRHEDAASPAWPVSYAELEPHYAEAEALFGVRGQAGVDPTEPPRQAGYDHAPVPHAPVIKRMAERLEAAGLHPFHMPAAVDFGPGGSCRLCGTCDAFGCRFGAKGDAETRIIRQLQTMPNVEIRTGVEVRRLIPDAQGQRIIAVEVHGNGRLERIEAPHFVLSAGAVNSALILLRSATEACPGGLANRSGVVGRYLMNHHLTGLMGVLPFETNDTAFPKTLSLNDFYHGLPGDAMARGNIQMLGNIKGPMIRATYPMTPKPLANWLGRHSVDWLVMSEDPPLVENGVRLLPDGTPEVTWHPADLKAHDRFVSHARKLLRQIGFPLVLRHSFGIDAPSHQCGTVRMGDDPATSALNSMCRAHDHPNLSVVDAGCFPSSAAVNPALTVAAQGLRVGAYLSRTLAAQAAA
ncbi:choline dehydrogenase-like flavoprotein [Sagittula marina]|uniref:Choline dehydrogenase-like flavoprotein n=1 Tax=Sagittula marina TaxID=943940 RepID=A0A7W6DQM6_9RHOB|nr:GMC family oxidoreductase [Sagittula marina]MBB3987353.1 choline dehydrogenase-like flavoprotein [Sagittula marina]